MKQKTQEKIKWTVIYRLRLLSQLEDYRCKKKMTPAQMAKALSIEEQYYWSIIRGVMPVSRTVAARIEKFFIDRKIRLPKRADLTIEEMGMLYPTRYTEAEHDVIDKLIAKLKEYKIENKKTDEAIAKELGTDASTLWYWFSGKRYPRRFSGYKIRQFLIQKGLISKDELNFPHQFSWFIKEDTKQANLEEKEGVLA